MSAESNQVRVALIGFGLAGSVFHAPLIEAVEGMSLTAIVTANPDRVKQARAAYPHANVLTSVEEIWQSPDDYDLVVVASPNRFHFEHAKAALEARLNVVVDKPISTTSQECSDLIALSKEQNKILAVYQNRRWDNDFLTVCKLIKKGSLGQLTRFESRFERYRPVLKGNWRESGDANDAGGLLFDLGSHLIDQACFLFGDPLSVYAELDIRRPGLEVDDDVFVALKFAEGVKAHLWCSAVARLRGPRFRVLGMTGAYEKYGLDPQEERLRSGWNPDAPGFGTEPESAWGRICTDLDDSAIDGKVETLTGSYKEFYKLLCAAIKGEGAVPVLPEEALRTMRVIEAAFKSASASKEVVLQDATK